MDEVRPITLEDLAPVTVVAEITTPYGRVVRVPFQTLSWEEWNEVGRAVPDPKVPLTRLADDGQTLLPNPRDEKYLEDVARASADRVARRVVLALEKAGTALPGATAQDKLDALKNADRAIVDRLIRVIVDAAVEGKVRLEERAESFRPVPLPPGPDAGVPEMAVDARAVPAVTANGTG